MILAVQMRRTPLRMTEVLLVGKDLGKCFRFHDTIGGSLLQDALHFAALC